MVFYKLPWMHQHFHPVPKLLNSVYVLNSESVIDILPMYLFSGIQISLCVTLNEYVELVGGRDHIQIQSKLIRRRFENFFRVKFLADHHQRRKLNKQNTVFDD